MSAEEDKKFDAVLGGFLVNDLRAPAGHLRCPELEVLAAYHERSLLPEEMNSWKEHIVGCVRCQAVLSELEATDSISLQPAEKASENEGALLPGAGTPAVAAREKQGTPTAKRQEKSRIVSISRGLRWQWLAPAGALAAGLLVWIAWRENQPPQLKSLSEIKTAKVETPSTTAPPASSTRPGPPSSSVDQTTQDLSASLPKEEGAIGGVPSAEKSPARVGGNLQQLENSNATAKSARKDAGTREDVSRDSSLAADRMQNQPAQEPKAGVAGAMAETAEAQTSAINAQVQAQQAPQNQLNAQKLPGPSPLEPAQRPQKKAKAESPRRTYQAETVPSPAPESAAPAPATTFNEVGSLRLAGAISPHLISAPGKKNLWRAGHAGMIEFSTDGGASWSRQTSNVLVDLTAGSAPSDKVCWIVGRAGAILLTTNAGSHWSVLHSPLDEDLGGVRATDALHATIWNLGNTKTFETSDGGLTWNPAPQ